MFRLSEQKPIELKEFLSDYNQASWLGYLRKVDGRTLSGQWKVESVVERDNTGKEDLYLAYNPLSKYLKREKKNIGKLALLYVDLDIGRGENPFEDDTTQEYKQEVVNALEEHLFGSAVPEPNYICDSGRGLYLIYKIYQSEAMEKQEHTNAAERWERINSYLTSQFADYCADKSIGTDEAHVLRVPGSVNSNNGRTVQFYRYSDQVYTLYNIERDYINTPTEAQIAKLERVESLLGVSCKARNRRSIRRFLARHEDAYKKAYTGSKPSAKQLRYAADIARILNIDCPNFRTAGGASRYINKHQKEFLDEKSKRKKKDSYYANEDKATVKMLERRLNAIEAVLVDAPKDSYREKGLFLYRLFALELSGDKKIAETMTRDLIRKMGNPIPEKEAIRTTRTAEKYWENGTVYKMSDQTIAEWFGISEEEWKEMLPKKEYAEDKERRKARNRRYYLKKLEKSGEKTKQEKIAARRGEITRLLSDGKNREEICDMLGISERTYYDDIKWINNNRDEICEEIQEGGITSAKNIDNISNRGLISPKLGLGVFVTASSGECVFINPFTDSIMCSKNGVAEGEWSALFEVCGSVVGMNDS